MDDEDFDIGVLLGGPVRAIQEAQIAAEREYMAFLLDYGLEEVTRKEGNKEVKGLRLRELAFGMSKTITDPSTGAVSETEAEVRAPLISLVQMPAVGIEKATIELDLDVQTQAEEKAGPARSPTTGRFLPTTRVAAPVLKGKVANTTTARNFRTHGKLSVKMTLKATHDDDLHGRLSRIVGDGVSALADVPE
jgi:hypothetical protein